MSKYYSYNARLESFAHPQRSKASPKSKAEYRWPHPVTYCANPESLAHAGFYYSPSHTNPDAVSCFSCNKGLADWDPEDDPAKIHAEKCPACAWAILTCVNDTTKNGSFKFTAARFPTSRQMEEARLETFGGDARWWPHEGKNTGPSSKAMARAGFIYRPADPKDDTCACLYCGVELAGWDPKDDPMEEHRSRQAKKGPCPFFTELSKTTSTAKRTTSKSKAPKLTVFETQQPSSSDAEYQPPTKSSAKSSTRSQSSKPSNNISKPKASSSNAPKKPRKGRAIGEEVVAEYQVVLGEDESPKPRPKPRRASTRSCSASTSRSRASSSTQDVTANETDIATSSTRPSTTERSRSGSRKKIPVSLEDPSPPVSKPKKAKPKAAAKKTKRSVSQRSNVSSSRATDRDKDHVEENDIAQPNSVSPTAMEESSRGRSMNSKVVEVPNDSKPRSPPKSFLSPADEELARDEEALEEQARVLMLADPTLTLTSTLLDVPEAQSSSQPRRPKIDTAPQAPDSSPRPPTTLKGKEKSKITLLEDNVIEKGYPAPKPSTLPSLFPPVLNRATPPADPPPLLTENSISSLTEEERLMTVEQWIRHEMDRQYELLKSDGRRKIDAFKERAIEIAKHIESL